MENTFKQLLLILLGCILLATSGSAYFLDHETDALIDEAAERLLNDIDATGGDDVTDDVTELKSKKHMVHEEHNSDKKGLANEEIEERIEELVNKVIAAERLRLKKVNARRLHQRAWWTCTWCNGSKIFEIIKIMEKIWKCKCTIVGTVTCKCPTGTVG